MLATVHTDIISTDNIETDDKRVSCSSDRRKSLICEIKSLQGRINNELGSNKRKLDAG